MDNEEFMEFRKGEDRLEAMAAIILDSKRPAGDRWHYYGPFRHHLTDYFDDPWAESWFEATLREHCYLTALVGGFEIGEDA